MSTRLLSCRAMPGPAWKWLPMLIPAAFLAQPVPVASQTARENLRHGSRLEIRVNPENLGPYIFDRKVSLMTHQGTLVEGKVVGVTEREVRLRAKRIEPTGQISGPDAVVATAAISVVHMKKPGSMAAPITGGILGGFGGYAAGVYSLLAANRNAGPASFLVVAVPSTIGGAVGGAFLGRELAKEAVTIFVQKKSEITD